MWAGSTSTAAGPARQESPSGTDAILYIILCELSPHCQIGLKHNPYRFGAGPSLTTIYYILWEPGLSADVMKHRKGVIGRLLSDINS